MTFALHTRDMQSVSRSNSRVSARRHRQEWLRFALCSTLIVSAGCSKQADDSSMTETPVNSAGAPSSTTSGSGVDKSAANGGGAGRANTSGSAGAGASNAGEMAQARAGSGGSSMSTDAGRMSETDAGAEQVDLAIDFRSADLAKDLAQAVCSALRSCLGDQKLAAFVGRESCEARFTANLAQQDFATLEQSGKRGRVKVTRDDLAQCYSDTRALGCKIQSDRLPASCQRAIAGQSDLGEACSIGADCAGDTYCPTSACPRVCAARSVAGGSCARDEECVNGLICLADHCTAPAGVGEACAGNSGAVCELGTSCVGSTKTQAGKCAANADVQVGAEGEACTPGGMLCKEGL